MTLDIRDIEKILPHRYPFLLVDRVTELVPGERLVAYKNVSANEPFFQGHFPGNPVMPGVLIIEALAQAAAILMSDGQESDLIPLFMGIDKARFRRQVRARRPTPTQSRSRPKTPQCVQRDWRSHSRWRNRRTGRINGDICKPR